MEQELVVQGRSLEPGKITWLAQWIEEHLQWSRKRLARELCELWCWRDHQGRLEGLCRSQFIAEIGSSRAFAFARLAGSEASDTPSRCALDRLAATRAMGGEFGADPPGEAGTGSVRARRRPPAGLSTWTGIIICSCGSWGRIWGIWLWTRRAGMWRLCCSGATGACARINFWSGAIHSVESSCTGWPITRAF